MAGTDLIVDAPGPDPLVVLSSDDAIRMDVPDEPVTVEFMAVGMPGRDGADGEDGISAASEWSPPAASATWLIAHNLGRVPHITVTLPDGETVGCRVRHLDLNTASLEFAAATSGTAHLL